MLYHWRAFSNCNQKYYCFREVAIHGRTVGYCKVLCPGCKQFKCLHVACKRDYTWPIAKAIQSLFSWCCRSDVVDVTILWMYTSTGDFRIHCTHMYLLITYTYTHMCANVFTRARTYTYTHKHVHTQCVISLQILISTGKIENQKHTEPARARKDSEKKQARARDTKRQRAIDSKRRPESQQFRMS